MACGFFGKLPSSGDFIARGLPTGLQSVIDRWLTRHVAEFARTPELWPETGLRVVLEAPNGGNFALLILPSQDAPGRHFPLAVYANANNADQTEIDAWADRMHPVAQATIRDTVTADAFGQELARHDGPNASEAPLHPPLVWSTAPPEIPAIALHQIFSSG